MPNTALTSPVETNDSVKMFNITFRAEILKQTISEWTTWKENTCYIKSQNNEYQIMIDAANLDAIVYVLLHESTHVVDAALNINPHLDEKDSATGLLLLTRCPVCQNKFNCTIKRIVATVV